MIEIKFKLYNKRDKKMYLFDPRWGNFGQGGGWVGGVLLEDYEKEGRTFAPSNQWQLEPESCEWLQFTGLLDKNGKEIYEGDIIQPKHRTTFNYEVYWDERDFSWRMRFNKEMQFDKTRPLNFAKFDEVIGSIWENKELLKES